MLSFYLMARRKSSSVLILLILIFLVGASYYAGFFEVPSENQSKQVQLSANSVQVFFSPEDSCDKKVVALIDSANKSIDVAMYSFTLNDIGQALANAQKRGVKVRVVVEKQEVSSYSQYWNLIKNNVSVLNDSNSAYMHDKFAVIDGKIVLTGSYNWSKHATYSNNENLIVINNKEVASEYENEFEKIYSEAKQ